MPKYSLYLRTEWYESGARINTTSTPTKASALDYTTVWHVYTARKMWQDFMELLRFNGY